MTTNARDYARRHYEKHKGRYLASARRHNKKMAIVLRAIRDAHLAGHPCIDCGERDPVVLEFDHVDPKTKCFEISIAIRKCVSVKKLRAEIAKCQIRCANCHRRKTARDRALYGQPRRALRDEPSLFD